MLGFIDHFINEESVEERLFEPGAVVVRRADKLKLM